MKAKKTLEHVKYRAAKGGHSISETRHKMARGGQGGGPAYDYEEYETMHPTLEHAQKHLAHVFHTESNAEDKPGNKQDRGAVEKNPDPGDYEE